jgi:hypothetical protein
VIELYYDVVIKPIPLVGKTYLGGTGFEGHVPAGAFYPTSLIPWYFLSLVALNENDIQLNPLARVSLETLNSYQKKLSISSLFVLVMIGTVNGA